MASENKKAESLCKNMSGLCGASCAFLSLEPDIKLSCVGEDWLCSRYCGCDYCNTLHYGCSAGEDTAYSGYVTELDGQPAVKIGDSGIVLTQKDVRAVQLAKAAIRAGVESLLNACGETADGIGKLVLAGGFGSYIDIKSAAGIGLIPNELADKTVAVGNAAGMGAVSVLLSRRAMEYSDEIAGKAVTLELSTSEFFMDNYVEHMMFM